ncbi:MAG: leucine-rich repeat domain-containing protein, partial [Clostridia bacterium]|nr:leucine-rich repeat domain-containing protein [Clostridia bacterium]
MKKKALSLIVALCMVLTMLPVVGLASGDTTAEAYPVEGGNIYYTVSGDEITIVGADPAVTAAVIPEEIDGAWVVDIAPSAFTGNTSLRHVTIPGTISYLEEEAFRGCTSLVSASLMQGVYSIGKNAFYGCMSLYTLALPSTLAYVYQDATDNCGSLSCVYYEGSSDDWSDIYIEGITVGNRKLNSAQKVYGCRSSAVTGGNIYYKVDSGSANVVGADAGITALNIPGAINNYPVAINLAAFSNFITMESVVIGEGVTSIGGSAFSYCTSLKTVTLPLSLDSIGTNAFYNCIGLSTVYYAGDASDWAQMTIDGSNTDLTDANIINMKGVTSTCNVEGGRIYFNKTTGTIVDADNTVTAADIPAKIDDVTVTAIGKKAFEYCSVLKTVTIPEGVTLIDESAFLGCSSLASAAIPEYVTRIGGAAFLGCEALKTVTLPLNLTSIGTNAFYGCAGLSTVYYTGSESNWTALLNNIGDGNNALTGAQITYDFDPTSVPCAVTNGNIYFNMITGKIVGADNSITAAEIPAEINGTPVASIGGDVFRGCYSLESISLPSGIVAIEGIEDGAFESCKSLKSITVDPANTSYASDGGVLFNKNMTALVLYPAAKRDSSYTVPDTVTSIGAYAFAGSNNLDSITISENVALIGWKAFDRCRHLASITVDPENAAYSSEDGVLFDKLKTKLIRYPNGKTDTAYTVPDTVTAIGSNAFEGSWGLASVTVPEGVLTIGNNAFAGCGNLVQISLPASLTSIGDAAFNGCYALETVHYGGTADEWSALLENVGHSNDALTGADVYCFDPTSVPCAVTNGN